MQELGYEFCKADPDMSWRPETRPQKHFEYFSDILCYVDDILCINHDLDAVPNEWNCYVPLRSGSVNGPNIYLGTKL